MNGFRHAWLVVLLIGGVALADDPHHPPPNNPPTGTMQPSSPNQPMMSQADVLKDIQQTIGFVPQFFRDVSPAVLPGFWNLMKQFEMGPTRLDPKTKELIGIAVASQIPCEYCIQFHTQGARMHGASEQEIQEAVGMAGMTRLGSTLLNGLQVDKQQFRRDLDRMKKQNQQARK